MKIFLTDDEVCTLTGYKHKSKQCAYLKSLGIPYRVNARGEPVVAVAHVEGSSTDKSQSREKWQPALLKSA